MQNNALDSVRFVCFDRNHIFPTILEELHIKVIHVDEILIFGKNRIDQPGAGEQSVRRMMLELVPEPVQRQRLDVSVIDT